MAERKNTLLLFSKVPETGKVKTRLSVLKDGIFQPEHTANLYHRMLFDVAEVCCAALNDLQAMADARYEAECCEIEGSCFGTSVCGEDASVGVREPVRDVYEFVISTTPEPNIAVMQNLFADAGTWPHDIVFRADVGANFDEHYNGAFQQCFDAGSDIVLSFGADMPALTVDDVVRAFGALHELDELPEGGVVIAPDQEMGVSIVGWPARTDYDHAGVYYCQNGLTVLPAYIDKARRAGLPVRYLPAVPDVDTLADLRHNATLVEALCYCAPHAPLVPGGAGYTPAPTRTQEWLAAFGWDQVKVMPNDLMDPRDQIDK